MKESDRGRLSLFVDRIDEGLAVLASHEPDVEILVPRSFLPLGTQEGDWLTAVFERDEARRCQTRREIGDLMDELGDDP